MMRRLFFTFAAVLGLVLASPAVHADEERSAVPPSKFVAVPDIGGATLAQADVALRHAGLRRGEVYEISKERLYAYIRKYFPGWADHATYVRDFKKGKVFTFSPATGKLLARGSAVALVIVARNDGKVPPVARFTDLEVLALPAAARDEDYVEPRAPRSAGPVKDQPVTPAAPVAAPAGAAPKAPAVTNTTPPPPAADRPAASDKPAQPRNPVHQPTAVKPVKPGETAIGSPEAPRKAADLDPNIIPRLIGLDIVDAETIGAELKLRLYVERVAGHPVGRILQQVPEPGTRVPQGRVVKVTVTAGGDFDAATPAAPELYLTHVAVPDVMDRTNLQARRILEALGLKVTEEVAKKGMAGRVVDQKPMLGAKVEKGSVVVIHVGPGEPRKPPTGPYYPAGGSTGATPRSTSDAPAVPVVSGSANVPRAIAPTASTRLPTDATIPMGFSWSKVRDATAYLLEVEEQMASGGWLANARKPVRTTAATLELERLDTRNARAFRWRVRAVFSDRQGEASPWIVMR